MTYNVDRWKNNNINEVFKIIETINPDVVCLQEMYFGKTVNNQWIPFYDEKAATNQTDELSERFKKLGYKNDQSWLGKSGPTTFGCNKWIGSNDNRIPFGIVMFSKVNRPLTNVTVKTFAKPSLYGTNPLFCFVGAHVTFNKKSVYICSTKLDPFNNENRQSEVLEIIKHTQDKENVIICGDFNEPWKGNYSEAEWNVIETENEKTQHSNNNIRRRQF